MKIIHHKPKVCVVGLGEIGSAVFSELLRHTDQIDVAGVDIDHNKFDTTLGHIEYSTEPVSADVYIIAVWSMDQILDVIEKIAPMARERDSLISIESTIDLTRMEELIHLAGEWALFNQLVAFPHRYMPGDPEHGVFNQRRVLGGFFQEANKKGVEFFSKLMRPDFIHQTTFWTASVCKVAENAHRAMEIILAQELKRSCESHGTSFEQLREAMNTKWNIQMREARDGVRGKCLPKDLGFFTKMFSDHMPARMMRLLNAEYANECDAQKS